MFILLSSSTKIDSGVKLAHFSACVLSLVVSVYGFRPICVLCSDCLGVY